MISKSKYYYRVIIVFYQLCVVHHNGKFLIPKDQRRLHQKQGRFLDRRVCCWGATNLANAALLRQLLFRNSLSVVNKCSALPSIFNTHCHLFRKPKLDLPSDKQAPERDLPPSDDYGQVFTPRSAIGTLLHNTKLYVQIYSLGERRLTFKHWTMIYTAGQVLSQPLKLLSLRVTHCATCSAQSNCQSVAFIDQ